MFSDYSWPPQGWFSRFRPATALAHFMCTAHPKQIAVVSRTTSNKPLCLIFRYIIAHQNELNKLNHGHPTESMAEHRFGCIKRFLARFWISCMPKWSSKFVASERLKGNAKKILPQMLRLWSNSSHPCELTSNIICSRRRVAQINVFIAGEYCALPTLYWVKSIYVFKLLC